MQGRDHDIFGHGQGEGHTIHAHRRGGSHFLLQTSPLPPGNLMTSP